MRNTLARLARSSIALLVCALAAWGVAGLAQHHPWRHAVPFAFLLVIWSAGLVGGRTVGTLASVVAAFIFAHQLFGPLGSIRVEDQSARSALSWMLLAGVAGSYLLLPGGAEPKRRE